MEGKRKPYRKHNEMTIFQYEIEVTNAFQKDCDILLEQFEKAKSYSFTDFSAVWKKMDFTHVYSGLEYFTEIKHYCENIFGAVKKYIMFPRNQYTQLGALYLLYGLYYKQPIRCWIKIRLTLDEYNTITKMVENMKSMKQYHAVYMFHKMKCENAFLYVAHRTPLGPEPRFYKRYQMYYDDTFRDQTSESSFHHFETMTEVLPDLKKTCEDYEKALKAYSEQCPTLTPFQSTLLADIDEAYIKIFGDTNGSNKTTLKEETVGRKRTEIKKRALKNQTAVYRADRAVVSAIDIEENVNNK